MSSSTIEPPDTVSAARGPNVDSTTDQALNDLGALSREGRRNSHEFRYDGEALNELRALSQGCSTHEAHAGWRVLLSDSAWVTLSATVANVLGVLTSLMLRAFLSPAQMGIWQGLKLCLSYANFANLGISKGAIRELSIARGRGETANAERGLDLGFTVNTLSSIAYAAVLVGAGAWIGLTGHGDWSAAWSVGLVMMGCLAVLQRHVTYDVTVLRSRRDFRTTSQITLLEAVLTLTSGAVATWLWGLPGLYASTLVVLLGTLILLHLRAPRAYRWRWDTREIARLIGIGSPVLLTGLVVSLFRSLDKLMILSQMPDREFQLGSYSLALLVSTQLHGFGNMLVIVIAPRLGERFGRTGSHREVARLTARSVEMLALVMAPLAALSMLAAPWLLGRMLPDYRMGLAPLVWLAAGAVPLTLTLPLGQYLIVVSGQHRALVTLIASTAFTVGLDWLVLRAGWGIQGVAIATAIGYAAYFVLQFVTSLVPALDRTELAKMVATLVLAVLPVLAVGAVSQTLLSDQFTHFGNVAAGMFLVLVVWLSTAAVGWWILGWRHTWRHAW